MLTKGQIVISKDGRDKNYLFIIVSLEDQYVFLVDGKLRKLANPKKKKIKHIQIIKYVDEIIKSKLENNEYILDSDIRKALLNYKETFRDGN
jgi:ribosomal protein L14E/L6E/L27E